MSVASSSTSSKASSKVESRRASSSTSSSSKSRSDSSRRSQSSQASASSVSSLDLLAQTLKRLLFLKDSTTKRRKAVMCECLPRYCFGSTAIFIIVFCLLCSLSALGPRFLDSMMIQDLQSEKEYYSDIDTSTCQIQPLQAPDREVQANFLTSYPGSGARLLSRLVEALSGIPTTDDVYSNGVTNTVGINTYYPCPEGQETPGADSIRRAAVLIRHPLDSIPSYHNLLYQQMNNVPIAPEEDWAIWAKTKLLIQIDVWTKHFEYWLDRYHAKNRLVVSYDQLLSPKRGPAIAKELAEFLNLSNGVITVPVKDVPCVWQRLVDEYELTLPPSERRPRTKRILPRKPDRNGSVRAKPRSNSDLDEAQNDEGAHGRSRSSRRGGDDDQQGRSKRGSKRHGDEQEEQENGMSSKGPRKSNRLGGKQQNYEEEQQEGEEEEQPVQVLRKRQGANRNGGGNQEEEGEEEEDAGQQEGEEEEQTEEVSTEGRGANQRGGNPRQQVNQQEVDNTNEEQSDEESNETEEGGNEEEIQEAEADQQQGGENEGQAFETATERRGAVQPNRGRPNINVANDEEAEGGEGEQVSQEGADSPNQQRWRERRRLSVDDMGVSQRRRLLEIKKEFPMDGRKELLIQLSRLLEKYHGDENVAGILVEYIDELERRYPTS